MIIVIDEWISSLINNIGLDCWNIKSESHGAFLNLLIIKNFNISDNEGEYSTLFFMPFVYCLCHRKSIHLLIETVRKNNVLHFKGFGYKKLESLGGSKKLRCREDRKLSNQSIASTRR